MVARGTSVTADIIVCAHNRAPIAIRQGVELKDPELVRRFKERYPGDMKATQRILLTGEEGPKKKP